MNKTYKNKLLYTMKMLNVLLESKQNNTNSSMASVKTNLKLLIYVVNEKF